MIIPWMRQNIQIISKLSLIGVWNRQMRQKEEMFFSRDDYKNVLGYFDYSRICNVTSKFTELSPDMLNFGITFILYRSQRAI